MSETSPATPPAGAPGRGGRRLPVKLLLGVVALVFFVWFAVENSTRVNVDWWVVDTYTRLIYVILVAFSFGVVVGWLLSVLRGRRRKTAAS